MRNILLTIAFTILSTSLATAAPTDTTDCQYINAKYADLAAGNGCLHQCQLDLTVGLRADQMNAGCPKDALVAANNIVPGAGVAAGEAVPVCDGAPANVLAFKQGRCCLPREKCRGYTSDPQLYQPGCYCQNCKWVECRGW